MRRNDTLTSQENADGIIVVVVLCINQACWVTCCAVFHRISESDRKRRCSLLVDVHGSDGWTVKVWLCFLLCALLYRYHRAYLTLDVVRSVELYHSTPE